MAIISSIIHSCLFLDFKLKLYINFFISFTSCLFNKGETYITGILTLIDSGVVEIIKSISISSTSDNSPIEHTFLIIILGNSFESLTLSILLVPIPLEHTITALK